MLHGPSGSRGDASSFLLSSEPRPAVRPGKRLEAAPVQLLQAESRRPE